MHPTSQNHAPKSRIGGYFFLVNSKHSQCPHISNGPLMCQSTVLKHVVSSVAEADYGALFVNAKTGTVTRETLKEMVHPQDATELRTDNNTDDGIANKTVLQKRSKAMDMRYYWIQDRIEQGQFNISWSPGDTNLGHYYTEHHSPSHHKRLRPFYLHSHAAPTVHHNTKHPVLRGCVNRCTTSQTDSVHVPSLGPYAGDRTYTTPPFSSTGKSYIGSTAILKSRIAATPRYSALRVNTMSDSQIQKTATSHCSAVRTHATPNGHTPTPHYDAGHTRTPLGSLMYRRLFPQSCISRYSNNTQ
jgi:hypothetical protein